MRIMSISWKNLVRQVFNLIDDFTDWCISENSLWGVPIPFFIEKSSSKLRFYSLGKILIDDDIIQHVAKVIREGGSDAWYTLSVQDLLPPRHKDRAE